MRSRSWTLVMIALGMTAYSLLVGRHLGSSFFLSALSWGWVAVCGIRGRLEAARDMALVMSALMVCAIALLLWAGDARSAGNLLSLGVVPSLVIWGCVILYVRHLGLARRHPDRR